MAILLNNCCSSTELLKFESCVPCLPVVVFGLRSKAMGWNLGLGLVVMKGRRNVSDRVGAWCHGMGGVGKIRCIWTTPS